MNSAFTKVQITTVFTKKLLLQFSLYAARMQIVAINSDGEGAIHAMQDELAARSIQFNPTGARSHVEVFERNIQEEKERCRAIKSTLPFHLYGPYCLASSFMCV